MIRDLAGGAAREGGDEVGVATPLTIGQVATLLGLPTPTIRSWERRYGVPAADRSRGGQRRYSPDQLNVLRRLRDLIADGRRPVEAARFVKAGPAGSPGELVEAFLQAARGLAPRSIAATLDAARRTLGLGQTVDDVLLPGMRQIGDEWFTGRIDVAHEHLATGTVTRWLANLTPPSRPGLRPAPPIVLSCGPEEQHTIGLEAFAALLRHRHLDCRMLGARTPTEAVGQAVEDTDAVAAVVICHNTSGRAAAHQTLHSARLQHVHLFYAGAGFDPPRARQHLPGHYLGTNLTQAVTMVTDTIAHRPRTATTRREAWRSLEPAAVAPLGRGRLGPFDRNTAEGSAPSSLLSPPT